jgi:hypothetical protein
VPRHFGVDPHSHRGIRLPHRHGFPAKGVYSHFEPSPFDSPCFLHCGSSPTRSNGEVERTVKTSSGHMVKCWIPKIFLTNPITEPSTVSHSMLEMGRPRENKWLMNFGCSRHLTGEKKWFSSLTSLSHKEYVTFGDDEKGKVLGMGIIKVNNNFTLIDVALVDKLGYNLLSINQLVDVDLDVLSCLILVMTLFMVFLTSGRFFKLNFLLLNPL